MEELKVKVGDNLLYTRSLRGDRVEKIVKVTKVTPTGRIRIDIDDFQYDKYGNKMGDRDRAAWSGYTYLTKLTEEDCIRMKKNNLIIKAKNILRNIKYEDITYEKALQIIDMFENKK